MRRSQRRWWIIPTRFRSVRSKANKLTVLELRVHSSDMGKVIGRDGRMADSIRTILAAAGMKLRKRVTVEILEQ